MADDRDGWVEFGHECILCAMEREQEELEARRSTRMSNPDLNPHKPAVVAMILYNERYAAGHLGSMGFWESLMESEKETCRECVCKIEAARKERR